MEYQRAVLLIQRGRYQEAQESLERSLEAAKVTGNLFQQIRAAMQLGVANRYAGRPRDAERLAAEAVKLAQENGRENLAAQGLMDIGNSFMVRNDYVTAERFFRQALGFAERDKARHNTARARSFRLAACA